MGRQYLRSSAVVPVWTDIISEHDNGVDVNCFGDQIRRKQAGIVLAEEGNLASGKGDCINEILPSYKVIVTDPVVNGPAHFYGKSDSIMSIFQRRLQSMTNKIQHGLEMERAGLSISRRASTRHIMSAPMRVSLLFSSAT
jgi:hypothetical protein